MRLPRFPHSSALHDGWQCIFWKYVTRWVRKIKILILYKMIEGVSTFLWAVQSWRSLWHLFPCCRRPPRSYSQSSCFRSHWKYSTLCWSCLFLSGQVVLLPPWRWLDLEYAELFWYSKVVNKCRCHKFIFILKWEQLIIWTHSWDVMVGARNKVFGIEENRTRG